MGIMPRLAEVPAVELEEDGALKVIFVLEESFFLVEDLEDLVDLLETTEASPGIAALDLVDLLEATEASAGIATLALVDLLEATVASPGMATLALVAPAFLTVTFLVPVGFCLPVTGGGATPFGNSLPRGPTGIFKEILLALWLVVDLGGDAAADLSGDVSIGVGPVEFSGTGLGLPNFNVNRGFFFSFSLDDPITDVGVGGADTSAEDGACFPVAGVLILSVTLGLVDAAGGSEVAATGALEDFPPPNFNFSLTPASFGCLSVLFFLVGNLSFILPLPLTLLLLVVVDATPDTDTDIPLSALVFSF